MTGRALAERFLALLNAGEVAAAVALLSDDFRFTGPHGEVKDKHDLAAFFAEMGTVFARYEMRVTGATCEGDRVALEAVGEGMLASGRPYANRYHLLFTVAGDRITAWREYCDTQAIAAAFAPA